MLRSHRTGLPWAVLLLLVLSSLPPHRAVAQEAAGFGDKTCFCWVGFEEQDEKLIPLETDLVFEGPFNEGQKKRKCSKRCSELCRDALASSTDLCAQLGRPVSEAEVESLGCFSVVGADDNDNNKWDYDGRPCAGFLGCAQICQCPPGTWYDENRGSCVRGACDVPGMPDGDKGGGYFAWQGGLYVDVPGARNCELVPRGDDDEPGEPTDDLTLTATPSGDAACDRNGSGTGTVTLEAAGGTAPYTLSGAGADRATETSPGVWEIPGLGDGEHTWTVTDAAGQTHTTSATVEIAPVEVEVVATVPPSCCDCSDGSLEVRGSGDGALRYRWDVGEETRSTPGVDDLPPGTYTVTVTDARGCFTSRTLTLPAPADCPTDGGGEPPADAGNDSPIWRQSGRELPVWDLGTLESGREYPTTVTARNASCRGRQAFSVDIEEAPWLRLVGPRRLTRIRRGSAKTTEAVVDLRGVEAGTYRGLVRVRCDTCPATCTQDVTETEVRVTVR